MFDERAEVVVPEEDRQLALLDGGAELTEAVVRQLGGRGLQELLRHQAWRYERRYQSPGQEV